MIKVHLFWSRNIQNLLKFSKYYQVDGKDEVLTKLLSIELNWKIGRQTDMFYLCRESKDSWGTQWVYDSLVVILGQFIVSWYYDDWEIQKYKTL